MKKLLCIIALALALVLALASCGVTPTVEISEDGYWVINGEKTDVLAKGEKGEKGDKGDQGEQGIQGIQGEQGIPGEKGEDGEDASSVDENPQGLAFFLKDDGTYAVEIGYAKHLSKIEIPATYNGKAVTRIGELRSYALKELTIPPSITSIGYEDYDSECDIERIYISDVAAWCAIEFIEKPFWHWELYVNDEVVVDLVIPDGVETISDYAFEGCSSLVSITIPASVTSIGNGAFYGCTSLTDIYYTGSETEWNLIEIASSTSATIHYNYIPE